ncbi:MAG: DUF1993 domain-containing protein [Labilithrix sp.]|nr:DUF1993 domain-containing protein [Labilithrix sp.]MCW5813423.1 DUF1993 domain-containing protein [Labilithrix sp.]
MSLYEHTVPRFTKSLEVCERWIDKTVEFAKSKNFDADTMLTARLAPDMLPLVRQFQSICDQTKFICTRLTGKEVPSHPDTEKTWEEVRARLRSAREIQSGFTREDFEGAEARKVILPWMPGKYLLGEEYVYDFGIPNLHFHLTIAYAILRHNGVPLGKADFIGGLPFKDA